MSTNITITSDDVDKSEAIGDFVARALELGGFKNVGCAYPRAAPVMDDQTATNQPSLLSCIRGMYQDFLEEPVMIRAVPVIHWDRNDRDIRGKGNLETEVAFASIDYYSRTSGVVDTVIAFQEQSDDLPERKEPDRRNLDKVIVKACDGYYAAVPDYLNLTAAAYTLEREGVIDNAQALVDDLNDTSLKKKFGNIVEAIRDETGYTDAPLSAEAIAFMRKDMEEKK